MNLKERFEFPNIRIEETKQAVEIEQIGLATDEEIFRDEIFMDASLHNPEGKTVMLLGLDVLPEDV